MNTNVWCMPAHRLMIQPPRRGYWTVTLNRHEWVTDNYVLVRSDVLKSAPKKLNVQPRGISDEGLRALIRPLLGSFNDTVAVTRFGYVIPNGPIDVELVRTAGPGSYYLAYNARVLPAWYSTDLQPRANTAGQLTWWGWVRGRPVLMGVVMPVRLFSNVERAA